MNPSSKHVVLGGNGVVGRETVRALLERGETPASVGRRPATDERVRAVTADLLVSGDVERALEGAEVAYLTVGLPYSSRVWAEQWPIVLRNTIDAALRNGTHLVYLDNVYAYGRVAGPMTEQTPVGPISKKGEVRATALRLLEDATARGLAVTIGRSADFYGPAATTSVFNTFALQPIAAGKNGTWLFDADQPHSLTFTPDIGDALALLGTASEARGRTWHLPTAPPLTGRQYIELASPTTRAKTMGHATMLVGSLFNANARETLEMAYQYTAPYVFESRAFETTFGVTATPAAQGIAATLTAVEAMA